jgi:hypothetical protein
MAATSLILPYEEIQFLLVYIPKDSSFLITAVGDTSWSMEGYNALLLKKKLRLETDYDDSKYTSICCQCAKLSDHLDKAQKYMHKVKQEKKLPVEKMLELVPRFSEGKRFPYLSLKVGYIAGRHYKNQVCLFCHLKI